LSPSEYTLHDMDLSSKQHTAKAGQGKSSGMSEQAMGHHHTWHGKSDAPIKPNIDCCEMHKRDAMEAAKRLEHDEVHHFDGQIPNVAEHAQHVLQDPHSPPDAKLNALDDAEALPHGGYLRGDL
ncbi:hypothetical protein H3U06_18705, partial [Clostridioides difficile]|uniref:hypothetical protein n=1 Tax=Clostridioides difficile TaxID=1496 RepID=UPI0021CD8A29